MTDTLLSPNVALLLLTDPYATLAIVEKDPDSVDAREILAQWKKGVPVETIPGGVILRGRELLRVVKLSKEFRITLKNFHSEGGTITNTLALLSNKIRERMAAFAQRPPHLLTESEEEELAELNKTFSWSSDIPGIEHPKTRSIVGRLVSLTAFKPVQSDLPPVLRVGSGACESDVGKIVMGTVPCYRDGRSFDDDALVTITPRDAKTRMIVDLAEKHNKKDPK